MEKQQDPCEELLVSLYERYIGGWLLDRAMQLRGFTRERARVLAPACGEVLEIGFGTGLNLPFYPPAVERLTVVEPIDRMPRRVQARIDAAPFPVERAVLSAEHLPFDAGRFDFVVSTWTLCTIPDPVAAL